MGPQTGEPLHNALVWQDTRVDRLRRALARDGGKDRFRAKTGLPLASYFSGLKLRWLLDNVPGAREAREAGDAAVRHDRQLARLEPHRRRAGGLHITDVTNASRTQLMDLATLDWDDEMLDAFAIPRAVLPRIASSSEVYGEVATRRARRGVPIAGILGDQQAALVGQTCFRRARPRTPTAPAASC